MRPERLSKSSVYAIHSAAMVAAQKEGDLLASNVAAAERGIPYEFLLRLMSRLSAAGILNSVKGRTGGYLLARPANKISLLDIVEAIDGPVRGQVPDGLTDAALTKKLTAICDHAADITRKRLGKVKLSDLV